MRRVLVVGGKSRSGKAFRRYLAESTDFEIATLVRAPDEALSRETIFVVTDYFDPPFDALRGMDAVVNFAGIPQDASAELLREVNVDGPVRLAQKAREAGVKQFLQISSLHIYGDAEDVRAASPENPLSDYARSKQAADAGLQKLGTPDFVVSLVRMPMHYGEGAGDKLRMLASLMARLKWFPAPRKPVKRSVVHLRNLAASLAHVIVARPRGIVLVADPAPFTLGDLALAVSSRGRGVRLLYLPDIAFLPLKLFANGIYRRLYRSNIISGNEIFMPPSYPVSTQQGLRDIVPK